MSILDSSQHISSPWVGDILSWHTCGPIRSHIDSPIFEAIDTAFFTTSQPLALVTCFCTMR